MTPLFAALLTLATLVYVLGAGATFVVFAALGNAKPSLKENLQLLGMTLFWPIVWAGILVLVTIESVRDGLGKL